MPGHDSSPSPVISSDRVKGTAVFGAEGRQVGTIDHLVIEKASGRIVYAVMSFGGPLGLGRDSYPIPWAALAYDTTVGGYVTSITEEQLRAAPAHPEDWAQDREWEEATHTHYGLPYYWV
ncbi:hypothetical protein with Photosynthetic reaction centre domain protein (PCR-barrel) [Rubellimicrobium mesophilum DSM 19309]|uniref:PRC-barrel domain-containing protein n=1 Tax=Rubellimicrobium mesophilum DSM 19309 TaxID=442562 RepID=A0A017HM09_9RHOB|nr:PRC-barrel domain-containing protein [Rubellimicrobium mesophilum]EYD75193.1 hypothetical protein with Photosynthetic reaction centre domain protein (PCR-barrel) [Rubellimicrobium mesophilum DSM 19309]